VTSVAFGPRRRDGFVAIGVGNPASAQFRPRPRRRSCPRPVPLARAFALEDARDAVAMLARVHLSGKLALVRGA
jgi:DNA-binding helix-hairpin-helix protein with protein kinase domain